MMKKFLLVLFVATILFSVVGCEKDDSKGCTPKTVFEDLPVMTKFAQDSSITATQDPSGLFYEIVDAGTGATPTLSSNITVKYVGRFTDNGERVDASNLDKEITFNLGGVIKGWQIGLVKIKQGGKMKMIVPSELGYGCSQGDRLNQPIYFYVELLKVE